MSKLRKKVINGLKCCLAFGDNYCDNCPYSLNGWECNKAQLKKDALALLEAQEPKVLSFAEAMLDTDRDVVWVEFRDDPIVEAAIPTFAVNEYADVYCAGFDSEDGTIRLSADQCGKIWRSWSLRPTDAQREAVKWE